MDGAKKALQSIRQSFFSRSGVTVVPVEVHECAGVAVHVLTNLLDKKSVLYLSGGSTPKALYSRLAEEMLSIGAVGMIDERFGQKLHSNSNERMIKETGLLRSLDLQDIPFYPMLSSSPFPFSRERVDMLEETADAYDQKVRELHARYRKSIGILGIGADGHTAGLLSNGLWYKAKRRETDFVTSYENNGEFRERISMTFLGLSMLEVLIVLAFGEDKRQSIEAMFHDGSEDEVPARFYLRPAIAQKTLLITDIDF